MVFAGRIGTLPRALEDLGIVGIPAHEEDQQRGDNPAPEYDPPAPVGREGRGDRPGEHRRDARTDRRAAMHRPQRLAAMLRIDHFAQQHCAHGPLRTETEPLDHADNQQLLVSLREPRNERERREPQDSQLQDARPAKAVAQPAADPPAKRGGEEVRAGDEARLHQGHAKRGHQQRDQVGIDHAVGHIHRPACAAGPEDAPGLAVRFAVPGEHGHE